MLFTHWHDQVMTDLRHEVAHALLNHGSQQLPLWLDEGLAEYFEVERDQRFSGHPYVRLNQVLMPLEQLEAITRLDAFTDEHYVASWMWIHFLMHRHPRTRQLIIDSLQRHGSGEPVLPMSRLLSEVVEQPRVELAAHFRQLQSSLNQ